jgi:hypothetical protein
MASQVLSGSSNPSYTNNTGQNVRVVINYMAAATAINWAGVSASSTAMTIGRNLGFTNLQVADISGRVASVRTVLPDGRVVVSYPIPGDILTVTVAANNAISGASGALPTELMLASGQTFSAICGTYNIIVIPEAG